MKKKILILTIFLITCTSVNSGYCQCKELKEINSLIVNNAKDLSIFCIDELCSIREEDADGNRLFIYNLENIKIEESHKVYDGYEVIIECIENELCIYQNSTSLPAKRYLFHNKKASDKFHILLAELQKQCSKN